MGEELITPLPEITDIPEMILDAELPDIDLTAITELLEKIYNESHSIEYLLSLIFGIICFSMGVFLIWFFIKVIKNSLFRNL